MNLLVPSLAALALLAPPAARGAPPPRPDYVLALECDESIVQIGESIPLEISLEKRRGKPVEVNELRLARNSVSLEITWEKGARTVTRIYGHEGPTPDGKSVEMKDDPPPKATLARGKELSLALPLLAIVPGKIEVRAVYAGLPSGAPERLESDPVEVEVALPREKTEIAAAMETSEGTLILAFRPDRAFNTVWNFLHLAKEGRYDGLTFHRVKRGLLIQGGDPKGTGTGGPAWSIPAELDPELRHVKGMISMARKSAPGSAGSQFFLMHGTADWLDGRYAAFGKVVEGMEVLDRLASVPVVVNPVNPRDGASKPVEPPVIRSVRVMTR